MDYKLYLLLLIYFALLNVIRRTESITGTHCTYKRDGSEVTKVCVHGDCTENGCECHPCYTGQLCDELNNTNTPKFEREQYDFSIHGEIKDVSQLHATDLDSTDCVDITTFACPCGFVTYAINSGNELGLFTIGKTSGILTYEPENHFLQNVDKTYGRPREISLVIEAKNQYPSGEEFSSTTIVQITFENQEGNMYNTRGSFNELVDLVPPVYNSHHRSKRDVPTGVPENNTFYLDKVWNDIDTDVKAGDKIGFSVHIWIRYTTDLSLECFAPPDVFILDEPTIESVGSDLTSDLNDDLTALLPEMESSNNNKEFDMWKIPFGTITNPDPDGAVEADMKFNVNFNAYARNTQSVNISETYWISCGAEYYEKLRIWVGQASFKFTEIYTPSGDLPTIVLSGSNEVMIGQTAVFEMTVVMKDAANVFIVDGFAPINRSNIMDLCSVRLKSHGKGIDSYNYERQVLSYKTQDDDAKINEIITLTLGEVLNSQYPGRYGVSSPTDEDQTFVIELTGRLLNTTDVDIGTSYNFGVSAEMTDIATIYTAQINFVAMEFNCTKPDESPALVFTCHNTDIYVGGRTTCQFNMTLPHGVTDNYHLEILVPFNMTAEMNICDISFNHIGYNFPCFSEDQVTISYESQTDGSSIRDFAIIDLGLISNTGTKNDTTSSTISIEVTAQLLDFVDEDGTGNGTGYACAGLSYGCGTIYVVANPVNFLTATSTLGDLSPTFSVSFVLNERDQHYMYRGGQSAVWVDIYVPKGSFFSEMLIDTIVPMKDDIPAYEFCYKRVTIKRIGGNIKCMETPTAEFESNYIPGVYDAATIKIYNVSNSGQFDEARNKNESVIRVEIIVCSRDHPNITEGEKLWSKLSVQFDPTKLWVGSFATTAVLNETTYDGSLGIFDDKPKFSIRRVNDELIFDGSLAIYEVDFILTPRTIIPYKLEVNIPVNGSLSVCGLSLASDSTNNIVGPSPQAVPEYLGTPEYGNFKAVWDMMNIGNFGQEVRTTDNEGENTMTAQVVMKISESNLTTEANFSAFVNAGDSVLFVSEVAVNKNDTTKPSLTVDPVIKLRRNDSDACVPLGGYEIMWLDLYVPPGSLASYQIEAFGPGNLSQTNDNTMFLCDLRLIQGHMPCLNGDVFSAAYYGSEEGATSHYHHGRLDLGRIASMSGSGVVEDEKNRLVVEIVASIPSGGNVSAGDTVKIGASVKVDSDRLWVGQQSLTVCETYEPKMNDSSKLSLEVSCAGDGRVNIAGTVECTVTGSIPEGTTNISFTIDMPKNQVQSNNQGVLLFPDANKDEIKWASFGRHFYCTEQMEEKLKHQYTSSSYIESEMTNVEITGGIITNIGLCNRYQWGCCNENETCDQFSLNFTVFATDHPLNADNAVQTFDVVMHYDNDQSITASRNITINRTGSEEPSLQAELWHEGLPTDYTQINPGDTVAFCTRIGHTPTSTRHAFGVRAILYFQSYLEVDPTTVNQTGRSDATKADIAWDAIKKTFTISYTNAIVFSDDITICFNATIDKDNRLARSRMVHATVLMDLLWSRAAFGESSYPDVTDQSNNIDTLMDEFNFYVPDCNEVLNIQPCQVTLQPSGEVLSSTDPQHPRFGEGEAWPLEQTVQITMGNQTHVSGVTFNALNDVTETFSANITMTYSQEGSRWEDYMINGTTDIKYSELFINGSAIDTNTKIFLALLEGPIIAKYLRMKFHIPDSVSDFNMMHQFTYDLNGCYLSNEATLDDACPETENKNMYERGYLMDADSGALYICMISDRGYEEIQCAFTTDFGITWTTVDDNVANVDFLRKDSKQLFGTAKNKKSRMRSEDGGWSWCAIPEIEYELAREDLNKIIGVKHLPFTNWDTEVGNTAAQEAEFKQVYNGTFSYMANSVGVVLDDGSGSPQVITFWNN